jgi:inorganic triphosphatase YgiF
LTEFENKEIEFALVICGEKPATTVRRLAALTRIGNYILAPEKTQTIFDHYFDTESGELAANGFGLRVRNIDAKNKITLKGKSKRAKWGAVQRFEIERNYNENAVREIFSYLLHEIKNLDLVAKFDILSDPLLLFEQLGLKIIQERKNIRQVRLITKEKNSTKTMAELAIDSMIFFIDEARIYSYEIEVELRNADDLNLLPALNQIFVELFPAEMQRWEFSKLSTGRKMQQLWNERRLQPTLDEKNQLTRESYELIRSYKNENGKKSHNWRFD